MYKILTRAIRKFSKRSGSLESLIDTEVIQALPYFVDYLLGKVSLIDISVGSESEAHKVFVSMNDRGASSWTYRSAQRPDPIEN